MKKTLDWNEYLETARLAIAEGCVLLENKNNALPLKKGAVVSVFGRIQSSYYKSGTGSGGKVNVAKVYNLVEGLEESGSVTVNKKLQEIYAEWEKDHPYDEGLGWGKERWSQDEMPLTAEIVNNAAKESDVAVVILGRTAGEDKDNSGTEGSYLLTAEEMDMLKKVRAGFKTMVVLLNVGNIIDMTFVDETAPDAVMYVWQGGMIGGLGTADVLTGKVTACGKLTDTIAYNISDYPSDKWFRGPEGNDYCEDIFVGYRYFETFAKDKVRYPFGYGLSYTDFNSEVVSSENDSKAQKVKVSVKITNTGKTEGKEIIQLYASAPIGNLGKAEKVLVDFGKTELLKAGESTILNFEIPYYSFASYDDSGITGKPNCFVLEAGKYSISAGNSIRNTVEAISFDVKDLLVIKECEEALAPVKKFERMHQNGDGTLSMEPVPTATFSQQKRRSERLPAEIPQVNTTNIKLKDVYEKKASIEDFVAQLSDEDLSCIIRGEGMGSSLVTPGTASAYGGVSPRLSDTFGIPTCCCDDGPSGMRLDCGIKAFSLPNGTMLASSYNKELITKLYSYTALEMVASKVDNLLGPGMNIHRHPLNGRNFEYFSEDPFVTGTIGTAILKGLRENDTTGTIKHFCCNNQEMQRYIHNSVVSQRALREIYLKGFEMAVRSGYSDSVMTTYGLINGVYTAGSYDLNTTLLRKDWGFDGIVMTDWWANISEEGVEPDKNNFAGMIKAQNDLYMCCPDGKTNASGDNTLQSLSEGKLTRGELQRSAINICKEVMNLDAMKRKMGCGTEVEIINRPVYSDDVNLDDIDFIEIGDDTTIDLTYQECKANANYILALDVAKTGTYYATLTGSSELGELAQLPCTLFYQGIPIASFVFNGTNGKEVEIKQKICAINRFCVCRLFVASNGLKLKSLNIKFVSDELFFPSELS